MAIRTEAAPDRRAVVRRPAVAGYYYPADAGRLREALAALIPSGAVPSAAQAAIVPHGSFERSGAIAGATLAQVRIPRRCVILGPSHTGSWMPWSLMRDGAYRTPLGDVPIDTACANALQARCPFLSIDGWAQAGEHAVEAVLPFLQRLGPPDLAIVPIIIGSDDAAEFRHVARALTQAVRLQEEPVLLIASSDLSHYQPVAQAAAQDRRLLRALGAMDSEELFRLVHEDGMLMCGYGPAICVLEAAKALGAQAAACVRYGTSAAAGGDPHSVTGYAGLLARGPSSSA